MRITSILPVITNKLFRVVYDDNGENTLSTLYDQWTDTAWLRNFFKQFLGDLQKIDEPFTINQAVKLTIKDADELFETLYGENGENLSSLFRPLHHIQEPGILDNQAQKGRTERSKSWLRLYAVHYDSKYIITGGAIKLTRGMTRPHLKSELYKLEKLRDKLELDINTGTLGYLDL